MGPLGTSSTEIRFTIRGVRLALEGGDYCITFYMSSFGYPFHLTQLGAIYWVNIYAFILFDLYHTDDDTGEKQFYAIYDVLSLHFGMEVDVT